MPRERLPLRGRVPDPEALRIGDLESALGEEGTAVGGVRCAQPFRKKLGGGAVGIEQPAALALLPPGNLPTLLVAEFNACPGGEPFDRVGET